MIDIVDYSTMKALEDAVAEKRTEPPANGYEIWTRYHDALCAVASHFGKLNIIHDDDTVAFYHGGDWFHHLGDGFAIRSSAVVRKEVFEELQKVVTNHHPDATLSMGGDFATPIFGLKIFITASVILVAWYDELASVCSAHLKDLNILLDQERAEQPNGQLFFKPAF